jgi:AcrR family transcriptional regulator
VSDEAILDAARTCLLARGPSATVGEIAARLGVSGPAILKRFGTKENLVARALLSEAPPDLSQGPEPGPLRPQLVAVLLHIERLLLEAVPRVATLRAGGVKASQWLSRNHPRMARRSLLGWLECARRSHDLSHRDLEAAADLLVSLVEARGFLAWIEPTWLDADDQWATRAVDALFGEGTPPGPGRRASTRDRG